MLMSMPKIKLNKTEKQELLKIKQKNQSETIRDRAHAVLLRNEGFTIEYTAKSLLRSDKFVKHASKLYREEKLTETHFSGNNYTKLSREQRNKVIAMIKNECPCGLKGFKFKEQFWTSDILRGVIKKKYKVEYKRDKSYYDLFKASGFSFHKPKTKDYRQDKKKIKDFKGALKKSSKITKIRLSW